MEDKRKFINLTSKLEDAEFRFYVLSILGATPQTHKRIQPHLFSPFLSNEDNCEVISQHIAVVLEDIEKPCNCLNLSIADTKNMRKTLGLKDLDEINML